MPPLSCEPLLPDALPRYRHAAPSGPWPWMDFSHVNVTSASPAVTTVATDVATDESDATTAVTDAPTAPHWSGYPQNLFGNWTQTQVERSQMLARCSNNESSTIYWMDVRGDGEFTTNVTERGHTSTVTTANLETFWEVLRQERPPNIRVRSLFVDHLTEPVLKMLGTTYNIEPFFFTSSINRIPSRYEEAFSHGKGDRKGDHITITLPFIRTVQGPEPPLSTSPTQSRSIPTEHHIDTQAPLPMHDGHVLYMDLLAIHMVRDAEISTIISYHPEKSTVPWTSAERLHSLTLLVGKSVYWKHIFSTSTDPTFLFLAILWYPLYAWDESFESLHNHISSLVPAILESPAEHSCYLQALQGRLLHYESLLDGYKASVSFIEKTPNPVVESLGAYEAQRKASNELMKKECENLLNEIDRLEKRRRTLRNRLKNLLDIANSNQMKVLIEVTGSGSATLTQILDSSNNLTATVRDLAAMRQSSDSTNNLTDATIRDLTAMRQILDSTNRLTDATVRDMAAMRQILDSVNRLTDATVKDLVAMRQISYLTMIFLPASFIASIFWFNVEDINGSGSLKTLCAITLTGLIVYIVATLQTHISTRKIANSESVVNPLH